MSTLPYLITSFSLQALTVLDTIISVAVFCHYQPLIPVYETSNMCCLHQFRIHFHHSLNTLNPQDYSRHLHNHRHSLPKSSFFLTLNY